MAYTVSLNLTASSSIYPRVAQLVEHCTEDAGVRGSSPFSRANFNCGIEEFGRPRRSHKPKIMGSNPISATGT